MTPSLPLLAALAQLATNEPPSNPSVPFFVLAGVLLYAFLAFYAGRKMWNRDQTGHF